MNRMMKIAPCAFVATLIAGCAGAPQDTIDGQFDRYRAHLVAQCMNQFPPAMDMGRVISTCRSRADAVIREARASLQEL